MAKIIQFLSALQQFTHGSLMHTPRKILLSFCVYVYGIADHERRTAQAHINI